MKPTYKIKIGFDKYLQYQAVVERTSIVLWVFKFVEIERICRSDDRTQLNAVVALWSRVFHYPPVIDLTV